MSKGSLNSIRQFHMCWMNTLLSILYQVPATSHWPKPSITHKIQMPAWQPQDLFPHSLSNAFNRSNANFIPRFNPRSWNKLLLQRHQTVNVDIGGGILPELELEPKLSVCSDLVRVAGVHQRPHQRSFFVNSQTPGKSLHRSNRTSFRVDVVNVPNHSLAHSTMLRRQCAERRGFVAHEPEHSGRVL